MNRPTAREGIAWRPALALRAFTLALLVGTLARDVPLAEWAFTALMLAVVGLTASAVHLTASVRSIGYVPVLEALACVVLLSASPGAIGLLAYLAVPPLAAGLTTGVIRCLSSGLVALLGLAGAFLTPGVPMVQADAKTGAGWVLVGVFAGLIASRQTRGERGLIARHDHALRGRDLLAQLEMSVRAVEPLDFDAQARGALDRLLLSTKAVGGKIVLADEGQSRTLATTGPDREALDLSDACVAGGKTITREGLLGIPLQGIQGPFGAAVLRSPTSWSKQELRMAEELVRELVISLDTALLFSQVTDRATAAERSRLARDIHDTVAQDIASLGYLIDDLASSSQDHSVRDLAAQLRTEITRIVGELRYSIFDLRAGDLSLAAAITAHARQAAERAELQLHLDVEPVRLSGGQEHVATHLQRIAQEAVTNAVRHGRAEHLWVRLRRDRHEVGDGLLLEVEDDGIGLVDVGVATGFGLASMRERAEAIGAKLETRPGHESGTVVSVQLSGVPTNGGPSR